MKILTFVMFGSLVFVNFILSLLDVKELKLIHQFTDPLKITILL